MIKISKEDIKYSLIGFTIGFVLMIGLTLLYNFLRQIETPIWMIQYTFYGFTTALFGFVFGLLGLLAHGYLEERKMKKIEDKKALESLKEEYVRCAWSIENNIEKYIEKNESTDFEARLHKPYEYEVEISEELKRRVQEYNEKVALYNILRGASKSLIVKTIETEAQRNFPKTLKKFGEFYVPLLSDFLMPRYFNGKKVTESWFKQNHPIALKNIIKDIEESEKNRLYILFYQLNNKFHNDKLLQRFVKEKGELIKHGKEIIAKLQKEIESLNEQLEKYKSLRTSEGEKVHIM